jgi:hypothetical protein
MVVVTGTWSIESEVGAAGARRHVVERAGVPATYAEVIDAWRGDADFRAWWNGVLAEVPFVAFRWETPPVTQSTVSRPFEFVVLDSPWLASEPDPTPFAKHFGGRSMRKVITFKNLGGDAILVVPRPFASPAAYGHVAAFVRDAPAPQRDELWQAVGRAMARRVGARPVWLSTAGGGVAWLHVRLDDRPKYYGHGPYRTTP